MAYRANEAGIGTVVIGASSLSTVNSILGKTNVKIAVSVAYPSGAYIIKSKVQEIEGLFDIDARFDEIYVVLAVGRFLSGYEEQAREEVSAVVSAAKGKTVKLIIEAGVMNKVQKEKICDIAAEAGVEYIVASTGFEPYDVPFPTAKDIRELSRAADGRLKIVACGNIETLADAAEMIKVGADRVCTTKAFDIAKEI